MSDLIKLIDFPLHGDDRGALIALESKKNIPFEIKRVYYIFNTQTGVSRGFHAHKKLQQMAICLKGSCRFIMDNGLTKENVILDSPNQGIFIDAMEWHEMHDFSDDCILLVLASGFYDEADYIRKYDMFLNIVKENE
jgi:dTDP-4-dehydrorhamnose 3,5-epimerase-like enzyme